MQTSPNSEFVKKKLYAAGVSKVVIERAAESRVKIIVMTDKPGIVIRRSETGIADLKKDQEKMTGETVIIEIREVRRAELDAQLTAESIAQALERRVSFRRAMKQALQRTMKAGAKGIKIVAAGRLGGAEIARSEKYSEGNVPLHTLRADIDYACAEADTARSWTRACPPPSAKKSRREETAEDPEEMATDGETAIVVREETATTEDAAETSVRPLPRRSTHVSAELRRSRSRSA